MLNLYKVATFNSSTDCNITLADVIDLLPKGHKVGVRKEDAKFHIVGHQKARIQTIVNLSDYNFRTGFTEKQFLSELHVNLAANIDPAEADRWMRAYVAAPNSDGCIPNIDWWIQLGIFEKVQ